VSVVWLVAMAAALAVAWISAGALALLMKAAPFVPRIGPRPFTALRAGLVVAPWLMAALTLSLALVPSPFAACHCFAHAPHHPHLCLQHPWLARPLLLQASLVVVLWSAFALWRGGRVIRELVRAEKWAGELRRLPSELVGGVRIRLADDLGLAAFTVGIWSPVVVIDRLLWESLNALERLAVVHHEAAHGTRRDALTLACLRLATSLLPWPANASWLRAWKAASEATCDRHAARQLGDATLVAMALVSVERLRASSAAAGLLAPTLGVAPGTELETRVRALLEDNASSGASLGNDVVAVAVTVTGLTALLLAFPGSSFHHLAESLLGLLTH
jgi:Zn-dependent protease with chaperone function